MYRTGSHALVDLLSEYDNVGVYPGEFDHFRAPANVADQLCKETSRDFPNLIEQSIKNKSFKYKLSEKVIPDFLIKAEALSRFFKKTIPDKIKFKEHSVSQLFSKRIPYRISQREYIISLKSLSLYLKSNTSFDEKIEKTRQWINEVANIYACNKDFFVLDQPVFSVKNSNVWIKVFEPYKLIVSIRNPRDQFADIIRSGFLFKPYGAPAMTWGGGLLEMIYGRDRAGALKIFNDAVKRLYEELYCLEENVKAENILFVEFEKLVTDYQNQKNRIENFIGMPKGRHCLPETYFIPKKSCLNINIYDKYLSKEEVGALSNIEDLYCKRKALIAF